MLTRKKPQHQIHFRTMYLVSYKGGQLVAWCTWKRKCKNRVGGVKLNSGHILLKLVLDEIGFRDLKIDTFAARKVLQKKNYLLQLIGIDLGYRYNWYLKGPYCPALAGDVFSLREEIKDGDDEFKNYELNSETKEKFDTLKKLEVLPKDAQTSEDEWLELVASLHYLKHIAYWGGKDNPDFNEVFQKLVNSKPHFEGEKNLAKIAWSRIDEVGLIAKKTLE